MVIAGGGGKREEHGQEKKGEEEKDSVSQSRGERVRGGLAIKGKVDCRNLHSGGARFFTFSGTEVMEFQSQNPERESGIHCKHTLPPETWFETWGHWEK